MKKEQTEASASAEEIVVRALEAPRPNAPPKEVVEPSDDESEGLITSVIAAASTGPSHIGPSISQVIATPDTSGDWELA